MSAQRSACRLDNALCAWGKCAALADRLAVAWHRASAAAASPEMRPALTLVAQCMETNNVARSRLVAACGVQEAALATCAAELRRFAEVNLWTAGGGSDLSSSSGLHPL